MQDKLEGVARERVDAFSRGGGLVALLASGGEPVSHILANLSIQQRQQVGMGTTRHCKMQKEKKNEGYSFANFVGRNLYQDPCQSLKTTVLWIRIGSNADSDLAFSVNADADPDPDPRF